jgi:hypothetical protein
MNSLTIYVKEMLLGQPTAGNKLGGARGMNGSDE